MRPFREALRVAKLEGSLFVRFPKLRLSALGIMLIPALYAFIYLESVWDPGARTQNLPAAIVNLDAGTEVGGQPVNVGDDLVRTLKAQRIFGFLDATDPEQAKRDVREGRILFALIVPPDFSANAMSPKSAGAGKLVVYASEGNNYAGAGFAKRFAGELGHRANETLNARRWAAVLGTTESSAQSLSRLREGLATLRAGAHALDAGVEQARDGARQLDAGTSTLADHVGALTEGVRQLGAGARALDARRPASADLHALRDGAAALASGQAEFGRSLPQLEDGARRLADGAAQLREETKSVPLVGGQISAGAGQLAQGAEQLRTGLAAATEAQGRLGAGTQSLARGVDQLVDGVAAQSAGLSTLAARFPQDAKLDELAGGSRTLAEAARQLGGGLGKLREGSSRVAVGVDAIASALPSDVATLPGSPEGLAISVEPRIEIDAPVKNNGMGFAPNFIPVALWLGAVMTAFIFHLRQLPEAARGAPRVSLLLGKLAILGSINVVQTVVVLLMSALLLGIQPVHATGLALTMLASSLTFMLIILALVRLFGDAGKGVALLLLIVQLSSAGGVVPIELTNDFYMAVSPWLPFTWAVKGVRASAFGAFGSEWGSALGVICLFAAGAFVVATWAGRWKFVPQEEHRPAMDL